MVVAIRNNSSNSNSNNIDNSSNSNSNNSSNSNNNNNSSNNNSSNSNSTQQAGLWTAGETHIFNKHDKHIAAHYFFEQPMFQKTHQKQEPIKNTKLNKTIETTNEGNIQKNSKHIEKQTT